MSMNSNCAMDKYVNFILSNTQKAAKRHTHKSQSNCWTFPECQSVKLLRKNIWKHSQGMREVQCLGQVASPTTNLTAIKERE